MLTKSQKAKIKKELKNKKSLEKCAKEFCVLGDPTKIKICYLLCKYKELAVSDIAELTGVSISAISHAMKAMKKCFAVKSRRDFRNVYYGFDKRSTIYGLIQKRLLSRKILNS